MLRSEPSPWKGFILGALGGIAGIVAMGAYWKFASSWSGADPRKEDANPAPEVLDSISLIGRHYREGESSTAAIGRILFKAFTGKEPAAEETKETLSYVVHWLFGMGMAGFYGARRGGTAPLDIRGGLLFGTTVWLLGDELTMPLLGLAKGPTAASLVLHGHALGAHFAYGLATAAATQVLYRVTGPLARV